MLFSEVVGQEKWKQKIIDEIRNDKIAHAQLFLGEIGHGSLALAFAYAQYLFCENRGENDSCGTCPSCNKFQKNSHPDFHQVFPVHTVSKKSSQDFMQEWLEYSVKSKYVDLEGWKVFLGEEQKQYSIGTLESVRLHQKLSLKSYEGGYKVLVVFMSEEMNPTFANKLLKLLEEPPSKTVILLVAEDGDRLLPTILSRTQIKKITAIEQEALIPLLKSKGLSDDEATSMFLRLNGHWGDIQKEIASGDGVNILREQFIKLMRVCYKKNVLEMMDAADEYGSLPRAAQIALLEYSLNMIRQSLMKNYTGDMLFQASAAEADFLKNFARFITGNNVIDFMNLFSESIHQIRRNCNSRVMFTRLTFQVMRFIHHA